MVTAHQHDADFGINATFVDDPDDSDDSDDPDDPDDPGAWYSAVRPTTQAFFGESIGNPRGRMPGPASEAGVPIAARPRTTRSASEES